MMSDNNYDGLPDHHHYMKLLSFLAQKHLIRLV